MYTIKDLYDLNETIAAKLFEGKTYPWEVLADIGDFIMKLGPTLPKDEFIRLKITSGFTKQLRLLQQQA